MNGQNYYENLNQNRMMADSQLPTADSPPPMSGSTAVDKGMPQFAAFEMKNGNPQSRDGTEMQDDRAPLNPSIRSRSTDRERVAYGDAPSMPKRSMDSQGRPRRPSRDQYGNPIAYGEMPPPSLSHQNSEGSLGSRGSRGRSRGGYGPPPRGYGAPRGGYGPPRGGYGPRGGYRGGPPPPGWNGRGRGGYGPPPPGYGNEYFGAAVPLPNSRSGPSPTMERPPPDDSFVAGPVGVPIGTAIEMDERTGSPPGPSSPNPGAFESQENYGLRDSDADVMGMVGLQQDQRDGPMRMDSTERESGVRSPTSIYSDQ